MRLIQELLCLLGITCGTEDVFNGVFFWPFWAVLMGFCVPRVIKKKKKVLVYVIKINCYSMDVQCMILSVVDRDATSTVLKYLKFQRCTYFSNHVHLARNWFFFSPYENWSFCFSGIIPRSAWCSFLKLSQRLHLAVISALIFVWQTVTWIQVKSHCVNWSTIRFQKQLKELGEDSKRWCCFSLSQLVLI